MLRSLFWAFNRLNELPDSGEFRIFFQPDWQTDNLTGPQIPIHGWGLEQGFWCCFAKGLNQSFVKSVAQDTDSPVLRFLHRILNSILEDFGLGSCYNLLDLNSDKEFYHATRQLSVSWSFLYRVVWLDIIIFNSFFFKKKGKTKLIGSVLMYTCNNFLSWL